MSPIFQSCSLQICDYPAMLFLLEWINIQFHIWPFLLSIKLGNQIHDWNSAHWEDFPSPFSFKIIPERGWSATAVHFWVVHAYVQNHLWTRPKSSLPLSANRRELPMRVQGRECSGAGEGTMDTRATSSCNLPIILGPIWAQSCMYHLHLMMECCCTCPTLWLCGSDNIQFLTGSSGYMPSW